MINATTYHLKPLQVSAEYLCKWKSCEELNFSEIANSKLNFQAGNFHTMLLMIFFLYDD